MDSSFYQAHPPGTTRIARVTRKRWYGAAHPTLTPMAITRQEVLHIARLARLRLDESEVDDLIRDLGNVLEYVERLGALDTAGIPPMSHVTVTEAPLRDDRQRVELDREAVLAEAPRRAGDGFAVPSFVDEG
jgi:aspartyl-tRNA(Asn)/glutamyl-tRNA(Gln) amidotransferase subunit C